MTLPPDRLLLRYHTRGVLLDTNLLVLYAVGVWDRNQIDRFKNTRSFLPQEFDLLVSLLRPFVRTVTTPHIMAEASNLLFQLNSPGRESALEVLGQFALVSTERMPHAKTIVAAPEFSRLGVADVGIGLSARNVLVLTADVGLANHLERASLAVVNFNHIRHLAW